MYYDNISWFETQSKEEKKKQNESQQIKKKCI